jgi:hypothetical protein
MKTLYRGIYNGCPIELAPTGYLLWCLDNNFMIDILADIHKELKMRKLAVDESFSIMPQPMSLQAWLTYDWFADWTDEVRQKFMSMVDNDSKYLSPEHKRFTDYYNNITEKLNAYDWQSTNINSNASFQQPVEPELPKVTEYQQHYNTFNELFTRK